MKKETITTITSIILTISVIFLLISTGKIMLNNMQEQAEILCERLGNGTNLTNNCCFIENGTYFMSVKYSAIKCSDLLKE